MSLGGKTTSSIDPDLKAAALQQLEMARRVGQLGFVPYKGATVAGFQPSQIAASNMLNTGLDAFGFDAAPALSSADLSPYPIYQEQLAMMAPGQRDFINSMFIDPMTGAPPTMQFGPQVAVDPMTGQPVVSRKDGGRDRDGMGMGMATGGGGRGTTSVATIGAYLPGGIYTRNPDSVVNRIAAAATSKPRGALAPTGGRASKAPPSRPTAGKK